MFVNASAIRRSPLKYNFRKTIVHSANCGKYSVSSELQKSMIEVEGEDLVYHRYLALYDRTVKLKTGNKEQKIRYDIVGHPQCEFKFSVAFPFHSSKDRKEAKITVIREYAQGVNDFCYCLPTGGFDSHKHTTLRDCALSELSEEAGLTGGTVVDLLPEDHEGFAEVKWCRNRFRPYLIIDPQPDPNPGARDPEEFGIEIERVSISELKNIMSSGQMMLPSITTCFFALDKLKDMGYLV